MGIEILTYHFDISVRLNASQYPYSGDEAYANMTFSVPEPLLTKGGVADLIGQLTLKVKSERPAILAKIEADFAAQEAREKAEQEGTVTMSPA